MLDNISNLNPKTECDTDVCPKNLGILFKKMGANFSFEEAGEALNQAYLGECTDLLRKFSKDNVLSSKESGSLKNLLKEVSSLAKENIFKMVSLIEKKGVSRETSKEITRAVFALKQLEGKYSDPIHNFLLIASLSPEASGKSINSLDDRFAGDLSKAISQEIFKKNGDMANLATTLEGFFGKYYPGVNNSSFQKLLERHDTLV